MTSRWLEMAPRWPKRVSNILLRVCLPCNNVAHILLRDSVTIPEQIFRSGIVALPLSKIMFSHDCNLRIWFPLLLQLSLTLVRTQILETQLLPLPHLMTTVTMATDTLPLPLQMLLLLLRLQLLLLLLLLLRPLLLLVAARTETASPPRVLLILLLLSLFYCYCYYCPLHYS